MQWLLKKTKTSSRVYVNVAQEKREIGPMIQKLQMSQLMQSNRDVSTMREHLPHWIFSATYPNTDRVREALDVRFRISHTFPNCNAGLPLVRTMFSERARREVKMADDWPNNSPFKFLKNRGNRMLILEPYPLVKSICAHPLTHVSLQ
jgi:hypothetical protein